MRRPEKLAELIREEIMQIVGFELDDPRVASVAVTGVRVTDNLRDARVFVTVEGTDEEKRAALAALHKAAPYVRRQLGTSLNLRYTPELHFVRDTVEESANRVEELLAGLKQDEPPAADTGADAETAEGEKGDE
ncbi:MAG TPA: 30S ribosome-binding factor RbfA [Pyrinomonadaceae bacterium]|nr:30S ribosome-binding factor RbfA [Pyrinomonadaceae bacterium]